MAATYDEALFNALYRADFPDGSRLGYSRAFVDHEHAGGGLEQYRGRRRDWLVTQGIQTTDSIIVVGCGFGWLVEVLKNAGYSNCWGIDNSPYIQANKGTEAAAGVDVVDTYVDDGTLLDLNLLDTVTGAQTFDWVIDEDAAPSMSDGAELTAFFTGCETLLAGADKSKIVHIVSTRGHDSSQNWKPLSEWASLAPDHTWIDANTGEVG